MHFLLLYPPYTPDHGNDIHAYALPLYGLYTHILCRQIVSNQCENAIMIPGIQGND